MKEWDPDERLQELTAERLLNDGDDLAGSERIFAENAIPAALAITHMAVFSDNERIRLEAAKYVVDRNLGRIGDTDPLKNVGNDPLYKFLQGVTVNRSDAA